MSRWGCMEDFLGVGYNAPFTSDHDIGTTIFRLLHRNQQRFSHDNRHENRLPESLMIYYPTVRIQ